MTRQDQVFYQIGLVLSGVTAGIWLLLKGTAVSLQKVLFPCVFHSYTGLYCPGCGGTRAVEALLQGRFLQSFQYHPLVLYGAVVFFWYMASNTIQIISKRRLKIGMHYSDKWVYLALIIVIINTLVKNICLVAFHIDLLK